MTFEKLSSSGLTSGIRPELDDQDEAMIISMERKLDDYLTWYYEERD